MFFVISGRAEVFNEYDGVVVAEFRSGSFFGEVGLFHNIKRTASVRAGSLLIVYKLMKNDFDELLDNYPDIKEKIGLASRQYIEYNQILQKARLSNQQEVATEIDVVRETLKAVRTNTTQRKSRPSVILNLF